MATSNKIQTSQANDFLVTKEDRSYGGGEVNALKVNGVTGSVSLPLTLLQDSWDKESADAAAGTVTAEHVFFRAPAAVIIKAIRYVPDAALTAADATAAVLTVASRNADGTSSNASFATVSSKTTGGGGSGNWTAFVPVPLTMAGSALAAGQILTIAITKLSTGTIVPAGSLQIDYVLNAA